ncbi:MAG: N-acetylmuramoyl-L-alanine amidase [Hydrogenophaga sp.]|uniref:N-acetylmuramoyl-L-alanine amidase n=1 Tax=Hydrogenophaga sp. TaxID=1904254 RepID=UPI002AB98BDE|nr:N-acetylmuramoyl-L-alanine amidase [Hydrogenophaga sp.]MDZ4103281.1 N-acetylmuramoyl-L-alanine amidase [Hydrogenophaga sp.]
MLGIQNHRLTGPDVSFRATPNVGGAMRPQFVVLHYTAGRTLESSVESLCTKKPQGNASSHIVLGRDGRIVQLAPFNAVTWHAGVSQWSGIDGLNHHAIGIEMDNAGLLHREGERCVSWFGKAYPDNEVVMAEHRHGGGLRPWHHFTEVQIERALQLCEVLVAHYGLKDVLGHEDIARGRKVDPGPAFPLAAVRARALGRGADVAVRLVVNAASLNIRSGPAAEFSKVAPALKRGAELVLLEPQDRWSRVAVVGATDLEGWVCNDFVVRLAATRSSSGVLSRTQRASPVAAKASAKAPARKRAAPAKKATTTRARR